MSASESFGKTSAVWCPPKICRSRFENDIAAPSARHLTRPSLTRSADAMARRTSKDVAATELFEAVDDGDIEMVKALRKTCGVNVIDEDGNTPLHKAAEGETACVKLLLAAKGAEEALTTKNSDGLTPLMCAIKYEDAEIVELMTDPKKHGLVIRGEEAAEGAVAAEKTGEAIALARSLNLSTIIEVLTGEVAGEEKKTKIVERRVSVSGDDINDFSKTYHEEQGSFKGSSDPEKAAELFAAVENGDLETVRTLRKVVGANVTDDDGNTPLHKAAEGTECVGYCSGRAALRRLFLCASNNDTPLMSAIRYEDSSS